MSVTVSFDPRNGSSPTSVQVESGSLVTKPTDPTRVGFSFFGWYSSLDYTYAWNFKEDIVTSDTTLYAKWVSPYYSSDLYSILYDICERLEDATPAGRSGRSAFLTFHDDGTLPFGDPGNGNQNGWYTDVTGRSPVYLSAKLSLSIDTGTWSSPIRIKGEKGDKGDSGAAERVTYTASITGQSLALTLQDNHIYYINNYKAIELSVSGTITACHIFITTSSQASPTLSLPASISYIGTSLTKYDSNQKWEFSVDSTGGILGIKTS